MASYMYTLLRKPLPLKSIQQPRKSLKHMPYIKKTPNHPIPPQLLVHIQLSWPENKTGHGTMQSQPFFFQVSSTRTAYSHRFKKCIVNSRPKHYPRYNSSWFFFTRLLSHLQVAATPQNEISPWNLVLFPFNSQDPKKLPERPLRDW